MTLPFEYGVLFGPLVVAWYVITELGSILENAGKLGAPLPAWFKKAIGALQGSVDHVGEKLDVPGPFFAPGYGVLPWMPGLYMVISIKIVSITIRGPGREKISI